MIKLYQVKSWGKFLLLPLLFITIESRGLSAQDSSNVSIDANNISIEKVLIMIERQTGYTFFYGKPVLDGESLVNLSVRGATISEVLAKLFKTKKVVWRFSGKSIIIAPELKLSHNDVNIDTVPKVDISGIVQDRKGIPLPGSTIYIKGSGKGNVSDKAGNFFISGVPKNSVLLISSIGFDTKQIRVGNQTYIKVELDSIVRNINAIEVVSTGYQTIPRERITGSFVQLDNKLLGRTPSTNILDRISYVTNGLRYDPVGAGSTKYVIRGYSTINSNRMPLVVIDGFPYEEYPSGLEMVERLNPNDVESITVLKDAAAASIWGARSGNGVIVVTTKKGQYNLKTEFNVSANFTVTEKPRINSLNMMSGKDVIEFEKMQFQAGNYDIYDDLFTGVGYFPILPQAVETMLAGRRGELSAAQVESALGKLGQQNINDDVSKYFLQNSLRHQYNLSIRGGSAKASYYTSVGYDRDRTDQIGASSERFTVRSSSSNKLTQFLEAAYFIDYSHTAGKKPNLTYDQLVPLSGYVSQVSPYSALASTNGTPLAIPSPVEGLRSVYIDTVSNIGLMDWHFKPLNELRESKNSTTIDNVRLGGNLKFKVLKGLSVELSGQYNRSWATNNYYYSPNSYLVRNEVNKYADIDPMSGSLVYPFPKGSYISNLFQRLTGWNARGQVVYGKNWSNSDLNVLAGLEASEGRTEDSRSSMIGFNDETLTSVQVNYNTIYPVRPSGSGILSSYNPVGTSVMNRRFFSYYANGSYTYLSKYLLSASIRLDAANLFGVNVNNRRVPLWSTGLGWVISSESFMQSARFIDQLKIRATYGVNGNLNTTVSSKPTIGYVAASGNIYIRTPYAMLLNPSNPDLTWERVRTINLGLDYSFFKNRLYGFFEVYNKKGIDLIGPIFTEATRGVPSYYGNYATLRTKGIDVQVGGRIINNRDLNWTSTINFSSNMDKVLDYDDITPNLSEISSVYLQSGSTIIGTSLNKLYAYKWGGLSAADGSPQGILSDTISSYNLVVADNNTKVSELINYGTAVPKYFGNILNQVSWKYLTLSFNIRYSLGYYFRRRSINYSELITFWNGHSDFTNRWKKPGDERSTNIPSAVVADDPARENFYRNSSILVQKGDHFRIQDVALEYTLDKWTLFGARKEPLVFKAMVSNIGVIWKANKLGIDPENQVLPMRTSYTIGLHTKF
ncbi:SusC/RagA family TonB-linked outer membrane protein [Chitinophaga rhizosphaerae]|uniref:SusC/RagA family TonB-linked outer membrane protein n=1 Tax=Chitinophaga rhizosphaerae TaxID=1864947 RepID=UPI000F80192A|nr:SusC/RagA family TonB-linked outer membrane protein [Chitinophaga rhizosphaerae]